MDVLHEVAERDAQSLRRLSGLEQGDVTRGVHHDVTAESDNLRKRFPRLGQNQFGSVGFEREVGAKGERLVWLERAAVDRLAAMRGPGESFSDIILRLAELEASERR